MELEIIIQNFILEYGLFSIFFVVLLEYANFPLPSEIVLPFTGIVASEYNMNVFLVVVVSVLGGICGSLTNYYVGYKFGNPLLFKLKEKIPKTKKAIKESNKWMEKHNKSSVMLTRLVPVARTFISIVAGVNKMNVGSFVLFSGIGITVWNSLLISLGFIVGDNMDKITYILSNYTKVIVVLLVILFVGYVLFKKSKIKNSEDIENE